MVMKLRVFIDFWNLQLSVNERTKKGYQIDWKKISPWLTDQASNIVGEQLRYDGTNVYMSYNAKSSKGRGLHNFATNTLDTFPGIHVNIKKRKSKSAPICPTCHKKITDCPHCQGKITRTIEKGIDTEIVTDLLILAWEKAYDIAVLVSSDRDFIPAIEMLTSQGYRIINAHFPPQGKHLSRTCWASIDLKTGLSEYQRT
jgi:uncharacterized LabA/DUF88 family protein